jgi:hypothetical protein
VVRAEQSPVERKGWVEIYSWVCPLETSSVTFRSKEQFKVLKENKTSSVEEGNTYACKMQLVLSTYSPNCWALIPPPTHNTPQVVRMNSIIKMNHWASLWDEISQLSPLADVISDPPPNKWLFLRPQIISFPRHNGTALAQAFREDI